MKLSRRTFSFSALCALLLPTLSASRRSLVLKNRWVLRTDD